MKSYHYRNLIVDYRLIEESDIDKIFKKFGIEAKINDLQVYRQAFVDKSYLIPSDKVLNNEPPLKSGEVDQKTIDLINQGKYLPFYKESYDRYEFVGDAILSTIVCDYIYLRYPDQSEGFMTKLKIRLIKGSNLSLLGKKLKLERFLIANRSFNIDHNCRDDVIEDLFEAFLGAIYIDFGRSGQAFDICKKFVISLLERYINFSHFIKKDDNYKRILNEFYHKNFPNMNPIYILLDTSNKKIFKVGIKNKDEPIYVVGEGLKKMDAEQQAAKKALQYFDQEVFSDSDEPFRSVWDDPDSESL